VLNRVEPWPEKRDRVEPWRVVVSAPYARPCIDRYREVLERAGCDVVVACATERLEEDELIALLPGVHGIICGDDRITARVLDAASSLRVIAKWGTGIDSIDVGEARRRGIVVCNTPNAFSEPVADTVMGYLLVAARQLDVMNADMHRGSWRKPQLRALNEQTLGIVGVGNCGRAVARRAAAFGMRTLGADIVEIPGEVRRATGLRQVPLATLLRESDVVSLNCTLNPSSFHLMNAATLAMMKTSAFLINTCRGPVVDERALEDALVNGRLAGAALDVFEVEPLPPGSRLRSLPNCWLAPHNANSSVAAAERVHERTLQALLDALVETDQPVNSG
jgi:phosphoglycerate dehydrogenase-like enzyme